METLEIWCQLQMFDLVESLHLLQKNYWLMPEKKEENTDSVYWEKLFIVYMFVIVCMLGAYFTDEKLPLNIWRPYV